VRTLADKAEPRAPGKSCLRELANNLPPLPFPPPPLTCSSVAGFNCITAMKALGDESRLRIVRLLLGGQRSVSEIAESLGLTSYNVSKQLRILREAGLVEMEKRRQQRLYSLATSFRRQLQDGNNVLDLGCCQFDFTQMPD